MFKSNFVRLFSLLIVLCVVSTKAFAQCEIIDCSDDMLWVDLTCQEPDIKGFEPKCMPKPDIRAVNGSFSVSYSNNTYHCDSSVKAAYVPDWGENGVCIEIDGGYGIGLRSREGFHKITDSNATWCPLNSSYDRNNYTCICDGGKTYNPETNTCGDGGTEACADGEYYMEAVGKCMPAPKTLNGATGSHYNSEIKSWVCDPRDKFLYFADLGEGTCMAHHENCARFEEVPSYRYGSAPAKGINYIKSADKCVWCPNASKDGSKYDREAETCVCADDKTYDSETNTCGEAPVTTDCSADGENYVAAAGKCLVCPEGSSYDSVGQTCKCDDGSAYDVETNTCNAVREACADGQNYVEAVKRCMPPPKKNGASDVEYVDNDGKGYYICHGTDRFLYFADYGSGACIPASVDDCGLQPYRDDPVMAIQALYKKSPAEDKGISYIEASSKCVYCPDDSVYNFDAKTCECNDGSEYNAETNSCGTAACADGEYFIELVGKCMPEPELNGAESAVYREELKTWLCHDKGKYLYFADLGEKGKCMPYLGSNCFSDFTNASKLSYGSFPSEGINYIEATGSCVWCPQDSKYNFDTKTCECNDGSEYNVEANTCGATTCAEGEYFIESVGKCMPEPELNGADSVDYEPFGESGSWLCHDKGKYAYFAEVGEKGKCLPYSKPDCFNPGDMGSFIALRYGKEPAAGINFIEATGSCTWCPQDSNYNLETKTCDCSEGKAYNAESNTCEEGCQEGYKFIDPGKYDPELKAFTPKCMPEPEVKGKAEIEKIIYDEGGIYICEFRDGIYGTYVPDWGKGVCVEQYGKKCSDGENTKVALRATDSVQVMHTGACQWCPEDAYYSVLDKNCICDNPESVYDLDKNVCIEACKEGEYYVEAVAKCMPEPELNGAEAANYEENEGKGFYTCHPRDKYLYFADYGEKGSCLPVTVDECKLNIYRDEPIENAIKVLYKKVPSEKDGIVFVDGSGSAAPCDTCAVLLTVADGGRCVYCPDNAKYDHDARTCFCNDGGDYDAEKNVCISKGCGIEKPYMITPPGECRMCPDNSTYDPDNFTCKCTNSEETYDVNANTCGKGDDAGNGILDNENNPYDAVKQKRLYDIYERIRLRFVPFLQRGRNVNRFVKEVEE